MAEITITVPNVLVPRLRRLVPEGMTPEEAVLRILMLELLRFELNEYRQAQGTSHQTQLEGEVRAKLQELKDELGVPDAEWWGRSN